MKSGLTLLVLAALILAGVATSEAQIEQGRLQGTVRDAQGGVLPGVTVTATSPELLGARVAMTESDGRYSFISLARGTYALRFELAGFQTAERQGIRVSQGTTLTVDVVLLVASITETITVTAAVPVVDTTTTKAGTSFTGEALVGVPSSTDLWGTVAQTPGVRMAGFDVGGSHKSQSTSYESFGLTGQNKILIEGVDTTEGTTHAYFYPSTLSVDEISVNAAGGDVEMSSPGTAVVLNFKRGGNRYSGMENFAYGPGRWVGNNNTPELQARGNTGNPILIFWEGHLELGGPVMKDRMWFYAAANKFRVDKAISGVDQSIAVDESTIADVVANATYKASQKDTIIFASEPFFNKVKPNRGLSAATSPSSVLAQDSRDWLYKGQWQRVWSNRVFSEVTVGTMGTIWPAKPKVDPATDPPRLDAATSLATGAGWMPFTQQPRKPQTRGTVTYYAPARAGSHDIKGGYEYIINKFQQGYNGASGPLRYRDRNGLVDQIELTDMGTFGDYGGTWWSGATAVQMIALYVQDRWRPASRMTVTAGLRFGRQRAYYEDGKRDPVLKDLFPAGTIPGQTLVTQSAYDPRLGVSLDVFGNGKTAVKAFYGRFSAIYGNSFTSANPGDVNTKIFRFLDQNGNRLYDGPQELGTLVSASGGASTTVDPNMKSPYADELNVSFEQQFWGESSVRVLYVRKMTHNTFGQTNVARLGQLVIPVAVPNPFDPTRTIHALDIPTSLKGIVQNAFTTMPDAEATYDTFSFAAQKRFARGVFLQGSFEYLRRNEIRAPDSITTDPLNTDSISRFSFGGTYPLGYSADIKNRQKSTTWQSRILGRYALPHAIAAAVNLRVQGGFPWAPVASISLPNAGTQRVLTEDVQGRRSDVAALLDLRVEKAIKLERLEITGMVNVYNVLNSNAVTNFFLVSGSTFNKVIATLDPTTLQLTVRLSF